MPGFKQYTLVLTGVAQQISDAFDDPSVSGPDNIPFRTVTLQAGLSNDAAMYIGDENVTNALYAFTIPAANAGEADRPIILGAYDSGPIKLSSYWALGTADDVLHVGAITF